MARYVSLHAFHMQITYLISHTEKKPIPIFVLCIALSHIIWPPFFKAHLTEMFIRVVLKHALFHVKYK